MGASRAAGLPVAPAAATGPTPPRWRSASSPRAPPPPASRSSTAAGSARQPAAEHGATASPAGRPCCRTTPEGDSPWPLALRKTPGRSRPRRAARVTPCTKTADALVCQVGSTTLKYQFRAVDDLHEWLAKQGDWVPLGAADENKAAAEGTVEAWGRSADNPVGGWYGLRKGYRGRFGMYLPPLLEALGLAELTHDARNNRMRAI